jgi:hypothetical protein
VAKTTSFMRTNTGQVIPDPTLNRRRNMPFSIGKPLSDNMVKRLMRALDESDRTGQPFVPPKFPKGVYPASGPNSIFNHLELRIEVERGQLRILFDKPVYTMNLKGGKSSKMRGFSLFSDAAKMGAPSFSLPAGPLREGGTCAAAGMYAGRLARPARGTDPRGSRQDASGNLFVCDACYATSGNYWYPSTTMAQYARLALCLEHLEKDPTGISLGEELAKAIDWTARHATYNNLSKRMGQEFGVWKRGQIVVPGMIKHRGVTDVPIIPTEIPGKVGFGNTLSYFEKLGVTEGSVVGFFRIHDSGDMNVGGKVDQWIGYLNAWSYVAQQFPFVLFWAPVRTYHNKRMREALVRAAKRSPNLIIRASAMFIDGGAPRIDGLASSSVHTKQVAPGDYECPVGPSDESSCPAVGCRACWIAPDLTPSYKEH